MARMNGRGQILLIGALTIAVAFLSLSIVLNGSLHTPSIAAEASDDVTGNEIEEIRTTIRQESTAYLHRANNQFSTHGDQRPYIERNISNLGESMRSYYAKQDIVVNLGPSPAGLNPTYGTHVSESVTGPMSDSYSTKTRYFDVTSISVSGSDWVQFQFSDGGNPPVYNVRVHSNTVTVNGAPCPEPHGGTVGITNATTGGQTCPQLMFFDELPEEYDIDVTTSTGFSGSLQYEFIGEGFSLTGDDRVYSMQVPIEIRSPSLSFTGELQIAPGEP